MDLALKKKLINPSICIMIPRLSSIDGQAIRVIDMAESLKDYRVSFVTHTVDRVDEISTKYDIYVSNRYYLSIIDGKLISHLKDYDQIIVQGAIPFLLATMVTRKRVIYSSPGPDPLFLFRFPGKIKMFISRILERFLVKKARLLICNSEWMGGYYEKIKVHPTIVPSSIDNSVFFPTSNSKCISKMGKIKLILVGDWDGWYGRKRQHEFISLLPEVFLEYPEVDVELIGLSEESIRELHKFVERLSISSKVKLRGRMSSKEVANRLRQSDIFVSSTISDTFYRPIVEAFACGLPALVRIPPTFVPRENIAQIHHAKKSGGAVLFNLNPSSFLDALYHVIQNYQNLRSNSLEYSNLFKRKLIRDEYRALFNEIMG
ncbi:hypothetical protein IX51_03830 [uncultured archaeon]|nr:hypothetical protein IX51_03830 [uncultured archaeon]